MKLSSLPLSGLMFVEGDMFRDERGSFSRLWCAENFTKSGLSFDLAQVSLSETARKGTLRGLHWQAQPHSEIKLVQVITGSIFDVVVDLRQGPDFGTWFGRTLQRGEGFVIPRGCAHGFLSLTDDVRMIYAMDRPHVAQASCGLRYDDPSVGIDWPFEPTLVSKRDLAWPAMESHIFY